MNFRKKISGFSVFKVGLKTLNFKIKFRIEEMQSIKMEIEDEDYIKYLKNRQEFENYLKNKGFYFREVPSDGNCLFSAIADQVESNPNNHARYRKLAVDFIRNNQSHFRNFLTDFDGTFREYLSIMSQDGSWGGHIEIQALSSVLKAQIHIYRDDKEINIINVTGANDAMILYLAYSLNRLHYSSIKKLNQLLEGLEGLPEDLVFSQDGKLDMRFKANQDFIEGINKKYKETFEEPRDDLMEEETKSGDNPKKKKKKKKDGRNKASINQKVKFNKSKEFAKIIACSDRELIEWCLERSIIKKPAYCKVCRSRRGKINKVRLVGTNFYADKFVWRCKDKKNCSGIQNIRNGNYLLESFAKISLRLLLIYIFTHYCFMVPSKVTAITLGFSHTTVKKIADLLSNWIVKHQKFTEINQGKFGGPNQIVEMDESCFFKRKNNKGRVTKQIWGFGFVVRGSDRMFVEIVEKRDAKTLIPIIQKWIDKNCYLLISDEWRAYNSLNRLGYNHKTVKHADHFVDPENPLVYTQTIENRWGQIKALMKKRGKMSRINFHIKIKELTWRIMNRASIQEKMLEVINQFNFE